MIFQKLNVDVPMTTDQITIPYFSETLTPLWKNNEELKAHIRHSGSSDKFYVALELRKLIIGYDELYYSFTQNTIDNITDARATFTLQTPLEWFINKTQQRYGDCVGGEVKLTSAYVVFEYIDIGTIDLC